MSREDEKVKIHMGANITKSTLSGPVNIGPQGRISGSVVTGDVDVGPGSDVVDCAMNSLSVASAKVVNAQIHHIEHATHLTLIGCVVGSIEKVVHLHRDSDVRGHGTLEQQNEALAEGLSATTTQLAKTVEENRRLKAQVRTLIGQTRAVARERNHEEGCATAARESLAEALAQIEALQAANATLEERVQTLEEQKRKIAGDRARIDRLVDETKERLVESAQRCWELRGECRELESSLSAERARGDMMSASVDRLQAEVEAQQASQLTWRKLAGAWEKTAEALHAEIKVLREIVKTDEQGGC